MSNNKTNIKRHVTTVAALMMVFTMIVTLSACSANEQSGGASEKEATRIPFSEAIGGEGTKIWYECQNKVEDTGSDDILMFEQPSADEKDEDENKSPYGRETRVVWIRVYQDGKLSTYSTKKNVYLGYFAKMTDDEIVNALKTDGERFVAGQEDQDYQIYIYSDSTGHEIKFEGVPTLIKTGEDDKYTDKEGKEKTLPEIPMYFMTLITDEVVESFQIYDSYYGGYVLYNYDQSPFGDACMVTRCDEDAVFGMDTLELAGAVVDYDTPEDLLHELNEPYQKQREERKKQIEEETGQSEDDDNSTSSIIGL